MSFQIVNEHRHEPPRVRVVVRHPEKVLAASGFQQQVVVLDPAESIVRYQNANAAIAGESSSENVDGIVVVVPI